MIAQLLRFALRQRLVTVLLALTLVGAGIWAALQLKIEAYPDISDTQVVVITLFPGRAAEEVEQQVTIPIERALNSVPGVIARRSRTIFGLSVVELTFDEGTNDWFARQVVLERLRDADLPDGVTPALGPMSTPIGELYRYRLESPNADPMRLRELQDWVVEPRFLQVPGVADVTPFGGLVKQFHVQIDPMALTKYGLSVARVAEAIRANNSNAGGALLDNRQQAMVIRGIGLIQSVDDIGNIVVAESGGVPVYVKDVARVSVGAAPRTGIFAIGEDRDGVEGIVLMRRGENPSEVLRSIKDAVADLNQNRLPRDVRIVPIYDRTDLVNMTLHTVGRTLAEGLLVVLLVLVFFLGSLRAAVLTAVTIPLSLLFAFICMHFSGIPANLLSLGAIDFGIIVDGSLVMVEHILHTVGERRRAGAAGPGWLIEAVRDAALEMERPIFYSLIIIISAYIPLFTLQRVERKLFTPMAFTVSYALLGSMLIALTLVPVLATYLFRDGGKAWENPLLKFLEAGYRWILERAIRSARLTAGVSAAIVLAAGLVALGLGVEFLPNLDEGLIWVRANLPAGISLEKSADVATTIRRIIAARPEVAHVSSQTGRNDAGTDPYGPNRNEFLVALKPYDTWPPGMNKARLVEQLSHELESRIPGAFFSFTQPIIDNVTEAVTGSAADLAVILRGPDLATLRALAEHTLAIVRQVRGAADTGIEQEPEQPQVRIAISRQAVARYGINVQDVQDVIEMAIGGRAVGTVFEGERRFDITVRYVPEARTNLNAIGNILVPTREGARVPLSQLASIEVADGATIIARRDNQRQITVRTNIRGRDQGSFVAEAQRRFRREIQLPPGYQVAWGGQFENLDRARRRLAFILPVTVGLIFGLLFLMFGSTRSAGLVLLNVPFSIVGGILMLYARNINFSVSAAVGFISLFGVAVMSGVLIIAEIRSLRRESPELPVTEAAVRGAMARFRGVLLMIFVALLGMVPAARATGVGSDVQRPLATVLVGGLLSTLLLALVSLPALYVLTAKQEGLPPEVAR